MGVSETILPQSENHKLCVMGGGPHPPNELSDGTIVQSVCRPDQKTTTIDFESVGACPHVPPINNELSSKTSGMSNIDKLTLTCECNDATHTLCKKQL